MIKNKTKSTLVQLWSVSCPSLVHLWSLSGLTLVHSLIFFGPTLGRPNFFVRANVWSIHVLFFGPTICPLIFCLRFGPTLVLSRAGTGLARASLAGQELAQGWPKLTQGWSGAGQSWPKRGTAQGWPKLAQGWPRANGLFKSLQRTWRTFKDFKRPWKVLRGI